MRLNSFQPKKYPIKTVCLLLILVFVGNNLFAQTLKVAVAANLQSVIKVLQRDFTRKTNIQIEAIVGSSGNLSSQIKNGAPYSIFLSADMNFPDELYKSGFTVSKPVVYALGSLVICSNQNLNFNNWEKLLQSDQIKKIALANPSTAPYGKAAVEVLQRKNLLQKIQPKIVYGESISQVNIYLTTGVANIGFTTEALVTDAANKEKIYWQRISPADYHPIEQAMVIIKQASGNQQQAEKFYQYMQSTAAKTILKKYGYRTK